MATPLSTILTWFRTGLKPTQQQFEQSWNSFWHKDDALPIGNVQNLQSQLDAINAQLGGLTAGIVIQGEFKSDAVAAANGVATNQYYILSQGNTMGMPAGTLRKREF